MTPDLQRLERIMRGHKEGLTRTQLAHRLNLTDRAARALVEEAVTGAHLAIYADRSGGGEAKYRLLGPHEYDLLNAATLEDTARAVSLHAKARGRRLAFEREHHAGDLFLTNLPELETAS